MVGNRKMSETYRVIAQGGGRAITSGDDAQLKAIDTGQPFRLAQQRSAMDVAIMKEIVRQTPELRAAVYDLAGGCPFCAGEDGEDTAGLRAPARGCVSSRKFGDGDCPKNDEERRALAEADSR